MENLRRNWILFCAFVALMPAAYSQTATGEFSGSVVDASGAVVASDSPVRRERRRLAQQTWLAVDGRRIHILQAACGQRHRHDPRALGNQVGNNPRIGDGRLLRLEFDDAFRGRDRVRRRELPE